MSMYSSWHWFSFNPRRVRREMALAFALLVGCTSSFGAVLVQYGGTYNNWPTTWSIIPGSNEPADSGVTGRLDFVGNSTYPGFFWASDQNYLYFRARVNLATIGGNTYSDTVGVLVDNTGDNKPDYAFAWDSKSKAPEAGLNLQVAGTIGPTWASTGMVDIDGSETSRGARDFNNGTRTGDGYVRTVDGQPSPGLGSGTTSFIDFAVSWNFLHGASPAGQTTLAPDQTWHVQFASLHSKGDNANFNADIGFGQTLAGAPGTARSMSDPIVVPEPEATPIVFMLATAAGTVLVASENEASAPSAFYLILPCISYIQISAVSIICSPAPTAAGATRLSAPYPPSATASIVGKYW